jgi:hypothetical protein
MDERLRRAGRRAAAAFHRFWRPTLELALFFVLIQVIFSQSRSVRAAWTRAKRHVPDPVLAAADAVAETPVGRAVGHVTAGVHAGADWVFRPLHATVAAQERRARESAEGLTEFKRRVREAQEADVRAPQRVIADPTEQ